MVHHGLLSALWGGGPIQGHESRSRRNNGFAEFLRNSMAKGRVGKQIKQWRFLEEGEKKHVFSRKMMRSKD